MSGKAPGSELAEEADLSGQWNGTYAYSRDQGPATPFLVDLVDDNAAITGTLIEPEAFFGTNETLRAVVVGRRTGSAIAFTKTYVRAPEGYEFPVSYRGTIAEDSLTITGRWSLLGQSGPFEMHRDAAREVRSESEEDIALPVK